METRTRVRILVVDDEERYRRLLTVNLNMEGFKTVEACNATEAMQALYDDEPDLIILDMRLPEVDGFQLCKRIRQISTVPILALTALNTESDLIHALDLGADDYMAKPFSLQELLARIRALVRRSQGQQEVGNATCGDIRMDPELREVHVGSETARLTPTEWRLMTEFVAHCGKVLTHQALLSATWGPEYQEDFEYLRVYIRRLRGHIEPNPRHPVYLVTHAGIGYVLHPHPYGEKSAEQADKRET